MVDAVSACYVAMKSLGDSSTLESCKTTLLTQHKLNKRTNSFWVEQMVGSQVETLPLNVLSEWENYDEIMNKITTADIRLLAEMMLNSQKLVCFAVSGQVPPSDWSTAPKIGHKIIHEHIKEDIGDSDANQTKQADYEEDLRNYINSF